MQPFPHAYTVAAEADSTEHLLLSAQGLPTIGAAAPVEFDGPGDRWSPESLLVAAAASCFVLTLRAVARSAKLEWSRIEVSVTGTLEQRDGVTQVTKLLTRVRLIVPRVTAVAAASAALQKTERTCLIANSLRAERELHSEVVQEL